MNIVAKIFSCGLRQVFRDGMLLLLLPSPFLMGAALRLILSTADAILVRERGFSLQPWYALSDAFVLMMTPVMTGLICAFLMLDERDEGLGTYYRVTPAGGRAYLAARLGLPILWAFLSSLLVIYLFGLRIDNVFVVIITAILGTFHGTIACMLLVVWAGNKVEGLALSKMTNLLMLGLPVAWFADTPYKYLLGFLPSFWTGELVCAFVSGESRSALLFALAGIVSSFAWIVLMTRAFLHKTS